MTLVDQIRNLARRPQGMCTNDVRGSTVNTAGQTCIKLMNRGELFRVKLSHRNVRWFADPAMADALSERIRQSRYSTAPVGDARRAQFAPSDPVVAYSPDFKFTMCPSHVIPRTTEHVLPFVHGGLRCA